MRLANPLIALILPFLMACAGERSVMEFETPNILVHTRWSPRELTGSLNADGCIIDARGDGEEEFRNPIVVLGTGIVHWPSATVSVQEDALVINGERVATNPDSSRNVIVEKDGSVKVDAFIP